MAKRRNRFQFSLRTFTVVVAICAALAFGAKRYYDSLHGPRIPLGTESALAAAMHDAFGNFPGDYIAMHPGWPTCTPTTAMNEITAYGNDAIPVLVANLHNRDVSMRIQTYKMLSIIDAESAVPDLIRALEKAEKPDTAILIATLTDITGELEGSEYYVSYADERKPEAIQLFRNWYVAHSETQ